jgi:uncharacterized glyoxalase superfamily protein PhnB
MYWGDRYAAVKDPFGVAWAMNAPVKKSTSRKRVPPQSRL